MNAHATFDQQSGAVALPADIAAICEERDKAIALWIDAHRQFHELTAAADALSFGGVSLPIGNGSQYEDTELARAFNTQPGQPFERWEGGKLLKSDGASRFARLITIAIDRRCWTGLRDKLGFEKLMDRQAREEFRKGIDGEPPAFNVENCAATFGSLYANRREIYLRGIANVFSALDRRFRSHDGFKIGARLIIERALNEWGSWNRYDRRDTLADVERIFAELEDVPGSSVIDEIANMPRHTPTPYVVQGRWFRVRVFGNGNLHLWFERPELVREVNKLLAEYYGETIGDGYNATQADDAPEFHLTPAKKFGAFNSSPAVADRIAGWARIGKGSRVLEPSAGTGVLARMARDLGAVVQCVELQPGLAHELGLAGFAVRCADFLQLRPTELGDLFDVIVMNPPFDRGRDCDHVRHALQFLAPGGQLFAVMAARAEYGEDARHRALHKAIEPLESALGRDKWHDLPPGSFAHAGTNVNTVLLTVQKPRSAG
jgi:hypothetical protein